MYPGCEFILLNHWFSAIYDERQFFNVGLPCIRYYNKRSVTMQSTLEPIARLLKSIGPCLTTTLAEALAAQDGISPVAARKRVSRAIMSNGEVRRLLPFVFPHRARYVYLQRFFGSDKYWQNLVGALTDNNMAEGFALAALRQRDGVVPLSHFPIICGAPVHRRGHLPPDTVLNRLEKANLVEQRDVPGVGACVCLALGVRNPDELRSKISARLIAESILLNAVKAWLRNLGIGSFDKILARGESSINPLANTFHWDLTSPSYVTPFAQWQEGKMKPGFVVCDVFASEIDEHGIRPFLRKCQSMRFLENAGRSMQIFVANRYTRKAFELAKKSGVIPATIETLFGAEVAKGLLKLMEALQSTATLADPEIFNELFSSLASIEGASANLRGALFEFWAADLARNAFSPNIEMNRLFIEGTEKAEVDVVAIKSGHSVTFLECKGYQPHGTVPDTNVEKWLSKRIPLIYRQAKAHPDWKSLSLKFEYWCTGKLTPEAESMIEKASQATRKYQIEFKGPKLLLSLAKESGPKSLVKALEEHFLNDPIMKVERSIARKRLARNNQVSKGPPINERASSIPAFPDETSKDESENDVAF